MSLLPIEGTMKSWRTAPGFGCGTISASAADPELRDFNCRKREAKLPAQKRPPLTGRNRNGLSRDRIDVSRDNAGRFVPALPDIRVGCFRRASPPHEINIRIWDKLPLIDPQLRHQVLGDGFGFSLSLPVPQHDF